jgi:hypothetical protein
MLALAAVAPPPRTAAAGPRLLAGYCPCLGCCGALQHAHHNFGHPHEPLARWLVPMFGIPSHNYCTYCTVQHQPTPSHCQQPCGHVDHGYRQCMYSHANLATVAPPTTAAAGHMTHASAGSLLPLPARHTQHNHHPHPATAAVTVNSHKQRLSNTMLALSAEAPPPTPAADGHT